MLFGAHRGIGFTSALLLLGCADAFVPRVGVPTLDDAGTDAFISVAAGREHTCALVADGSAYCWGSNEFGQVGVADDGTSCPRDDRAIPCQKGPVAVDGGLTFQKLSAGGTHTCGLDLDYHIYCWGQNLLGALGDPAIAQSFTPVRVVSTALFMDLAAGGSHTCGLRTDAVLLCWGANESGQLGLNIVGTGTAVPATVSTAQRFASVAAGEHRTCARAANGAAFCWGLSVLLRGSDEVTRLQPTPLRVAGDTLFQSLTVGTSTTCGVSVDNLAYCWESNAFGSLGDGTTAGSPTPTRVRAPLRFVALSSGATQTCGITDDASAHCWGGDNFGQLGVSSSLLTERCGASPSRIPCSRTPVRVSGWRRFAQISAGRGNHVCALTIGGNIYCWGAGGMGQRGDGRTSSGESSPVKTRPI